VSDALVRVENLVVDYGHTRALRGVSLEIERGEVFALVGGSGSGKSTLGRAILALLRPMPREGHVFFDGRDIGHMSRSDLREFRRDAQIVFQDPDASLNPRMTVGEALGEVLKLNPPKEGRPRLVAELLEQVGLEAVHDRRYPHELSGGQKQRISIARALAVGPRFLVLDEPLSALDVSVQAQILLLLADLRTRHDLTYLFISHDLAIVDNVADRVAVMTAGEIVETGPTSAVFAKPREPYTRSLLAAVPKALRRP